MQRVILETPYAGERGGRTWNDDDVQKNLRYLRACMHDSITRGEAPLASHGLYTQPGVLHDGSPLERELGIQAGFAWRAVAEKTVVYSNLGISKGMQYGIDHALAHNGCIEYRELAIDWDNWQLGLGE
jgi:hypothetical protein